MNTLAIVLRAPERLELCSLPLVAPQPGQIVVDVEWSAISTGTERLLWNGSMPAFPGMGYPLVPGYETVGRVAVADASTDLTVGDRVFAPGASCYGDVRGLFGGAASRLVVAASRVVRVPDSLGEDAVLLALAATAQHALAGGFVPDLIIGHGVLGRILARLALASGGAPIVWETNAARAAGARSYRVVHPDEDSRETYRSIYDVSGDASRLDTWIGRLARGGEIVLAGFYPQPIQFAFPPAFMREARVRIAAEWQPDDLRAALALISNGLLDLTGLITHRSSFRAAAAAYRTAFTDPACLKMLIDWRDDA